MTTVYADTRLRVERVGAGDYRVQDRYFVRRRPEGFWIWEDGVTGEIFDAPSKAACLTAIRRRIDAPRKAVRPDWNWRT